MAQDVSTYRWLIAAASAEKSRISSAVLNRRFDPAVIVMAASGLCDFKRSSRSSA